MPKFFCVEQSSRKPSGMPPHLLGDLLQKGDAIAGRLRVPGARPALDAAVDEIDDNTEIGRRSSARHVVAGPNPCGAGIRRRQALSEASFALRRQAGSSLRKRST